MNNFMKLEEALKILVNHNKWRRDQSVPPIMKQTDPKQLGIAIDIAIDTLTEKIEYNNK